MTMAFIRKAAPWFWIAFITTKAKTTGATKHSFHTGGTRKNLIGPVGVPFGYFAHGVFHISVDNFILVPKHGESPDVLGHVEAGFLLEKYKNEAAYNQHMDVLMTNTSECLFQYFAADEDEYNFDDDFQYSTGGISSAEHGIFLSMRPEKDRTKPSSATIEYRFKP